MMILLIVKLLRMKRVVTPDILVTPAFGDFSIGFSFLQVTSAFDKTNFLIWYDLASLIKIIWPLSVEFSI